MSELMDKVIDRVQQGWCQGTMYDDDGNACLLGAMSRTAGRNSEAYADLSRFIHRVIADEHHDTTIPYFNDHIAESVEDVILVCKKAGALLDEREAS